MENKQVEAKLLENLQEGLQLISRDWRYLYLNPTALMHSQSNYESLIGHTMMECFPGIENTALFTKLQYVMEQQVPVQMENHFHYPNGKSGWFELRIQPSIDGLVILSVDITLRKIEEERRNRYVAGLEGVVDDVSHKMRAPLTLLQSIVENELEFVASHPELASIVGYLKESVLALDAHTRDLTQKIQDLREGVR